MVQKSVQFMNDLKLIPSESKKYHCSIDLYTETKYPTEKISLVLDSKLSVFNFGI